MQKWKKNIKNYLLSGYNWRLGIGFVFGLVVSALLMDFEFFAGSIRNHPFTIEFSNFLALLTGSITKLLGYDVNIIENAIRFSHNNGIYFAYGCLGYREMIWFALFMLVAPGPFMHKLWYIPLGLVIIEISNILRAVSIGISNFHAPQTFEVIHAQGTLWFVYGTVLALWLFWLSFLKK
jgi:exosortase/archaeosortase family protein